MIAWSKARNLKDYLIMVKITNRDTEASEVAWCNEKRCQVSRYIQETCEFEDADGNKYDISKGVVNCNADFTAYKLRCSSCSK